MPRAPETAAPAASAAPPGPGRDAGLLTIGAFSRVTGLTLKMLRLYDERGLVPPTHVDPASGYRYYGEAALERARQVAHLRELEFSLADIAEMLGELDGAIGLVPFLEAQRERIAERQRRLAHVQKTIERMIAAERRALAAEQAGLETKDVPAQLVATLRFRGRYDETGPVLRRLLRGFGRVAGGSAFNLYHDLEWREDDADIECCVPLRERREVTGIVVRTLSAARVTSVVHRGPYSEIGRSYARLFQAIAARQLRPVGPIREIYHRGPGMLLAGNPANYRTELQVEVATEDSTPA
jgi:DNA-binding transcriptional MerR regulator